MKIKSILAAAVLLMSATAASAQATKVAEDGTKYEFKGHTFLNLGVGAQYTLGEAKFGKLISPNVQIGLGYQFTPVFGARIQANAWQSKGGWNGYMPAGSTTAYTNDYKWNYVAPGIDFMFNLSNWWGGWNPKRVFSVTAFLGGGANIAFKNNEANDIAKTLQSVDAYNMPYIWDGTKVRFFGRGGLEGAFRLSDAVALTIEANANLLSDKYNSKKAEKKMKADWYFNALVGVRVNLGPTYTSTALAPPAEVVEPVPMVQVERVEEPAPEPRPQQPQQQTVEPLRRDVFFLINRYDIRPVEQQKVREIAEYLRRYPRTRVTVTGYADAGTGNDQINDRLAAQRADAVLRELRDRYNIEGERIFYDYKGARIQPFEENNLNRVAICVAE